MLTNLIRAKMSTHSLAVAIGALMFFANHFLSDPHADAWLRAHWVVKDLYESGGALLIFLGVYKTPVGRSA